MNLATTVRRLFARPYTTVTAAKARELTADRRGTLLDVREPHEWLSGHAPGARHIPLGQLADRAAELPAGQPVVAMCHTGMRSARAAALLGRQGREAYNLRGGLIAWRRAGLPVSTGARRR